MSTSTISGTTVSTGVTLGSGYTSPLTITASGAVETSSGNAITGPNTNAWSVINQGTITAPGYGIALLDGGRVDNSGWIEGGSPGGPIKISGNTGTVTNSGTLLGVGVRSLGVYLGAGGTVTNTAGLIEAACGVYIKGGGTLFNQATIFGTATFGKFYDYPATVYFKFGSIATAINTGTIVCLSDTANYAVELSGGGSVYNGSTGLIEAITGIKISHTAGTVTNLGTILGTSGYPSIGVKLLTGGTVSNNAGLIQGGRGVYVKSVAGTVINAATIVGTTYYGIELLAGGSVANNGGMIIGPAGVSIEGGSGTITNAATIQGTAGATNAGVNLKAGGGVTNAAGGLIAAVYGVKMTGSAGTVSNAGTIRGTSANSVGVYLTKGGSINNSAGLIVGNRGVAIGGSAGTVTNSGTISGTAGLGIYLILGGTVVNSGTIAGGPGTAISFGGAANNLLVLQHGYKLSGAIIGGTYANDTLGLAGSVSSAVTVNYNTLGLMSFEDILFGADGYNTLKINNKSGTFGLTISGFDQTSEIIDLTAIGSNGTISDNDIVNHRLTISGSAGTVTLQLDATDESNFTTVSDGNGGTDVTVACFRRGTLILTERGEVPVEMLEVGARLVTREGVAKPVKWIGRRSYAGWLAAGNPQVLPVCFKRGSLADGVPRRDLWVSPEHAMYLDGVLVPAALLVNGSSIVKTEAVEEVHYFHLELDAHEVILAEGAWAESFVDDDSRGIFHNAAEYRARYPQAPVGAPAHYCAPRVEDGFELEALRRRLAGRARRRLADGTAPEAALAGNLDVVTHGRIGGWVRDPAAPGTPVALVVLANGAEIGRVTADRYRGDLEAAGIGDGRHAFELAVPGGLAAGSAYEIAVCRADDGAPLPGSPRLLQRAVPAAKAGAPARREAGVAAVAVPLGRLRGNLEHAGRTGLYGWAQDYAAGERAVGLLVAVNGTTVGRVLANRYRADLEVAGIGCGRHGFELVLASPLPPFAAQEIRVTREADGAELPGSPLLLPAATRLDERAERALAESLAGLAASDEARTLALLTREADRLLARRAERQGGRAERQALLLFRRRWGAAAAAASATDGLRALVVDAQVPDAARDAGSSAILSHIRALQALGYAVSFAAAEAMHEADALERLADAESVTPCGRPFYSCVEDILSRQAGSFDLVYLHRAPIADRYLPLVRRYSPKARILYSVADLHHLRLARQAGIEQRPELLAYSRHLAALELSAARRADVVLTHSLVEAELLRRVVGSAPGGSAKVHVVPFAVAARRPPRPFAARQGIAFIGSAGHPPNGDAVHHLVRDILPLVWQADPTITCKIAGHGWQTSRMPQFDRRIEVVGAVKDLASVFDAVRLTVAPLRFGAGIKGKVLDSFAAGLPCVLTGIAAEGLPLAGPLSHLIADNPEALAQLILHLHADEPANTRIGEAATRLIADEFCFEHVTATLGAALSDRRSETTPRSLNAQSEQPLLSVA